jgi:hypothetical protein
MLIARAPMRISFGGGGTDLEAYYAKYSCSWLDKKRHPKLQDRREEKKGEVLFPDRFRHFLSTSCPW